MTELHLVENSQFPPALWTAFDTLVRGIGSDSFYKDVTSVMDGLVHFDRFYLFDGRGTVDGLEPLHAKTEEGKPEVGHETYASRFLPADPVQQAINAASESGLMARLKVCPEDIVVPAYRAMMEQAGVKERVSFVQGHGEGWRCVTFVRRVPYDGFSSQELVILEGFVRLLSPMVDRQRQLTGEVVQDRVARIADLERRFERICPELTARERQICARAAIGVSIEGTALELGVASSTVLTYRKRAYHRLGLTSAYELARLVMR